MGKQKKEIRSPDTSDNISPEYHCSVFFLYNKQRKMQEYCIRLETTKVFSTFNYQLTVKAEKKKNTIDLKITGLSPDHTYLATVKPAICDILFQELYGDYIIKIIKQDGSTNSAVYNFNVFKPEIKLLQVIESSDKNARQFCTFFTADDLNTFE